MGLISQTGPTRELPDADSYTMELCFWQQGDEVELSLVDEDHRSWNLVLEGELDEFTYKRSSKDATKVRLARSSTLKEDSSSYFRGGSDEVAVKFACTSDTRCVSLHLIVPSSIALLGNQH